MTTTAEVSGAITDSTNGAPEIGWQVDLNESYEGQVIRGTLSITTNSEGIYSLPVVPPGTITIKIVPPTSGWALVDPAGGTRTITVAAAQTYDIENFVVVPLVTVTGVSRTGSGRHPAIELNFSGPVDSTDASTRSSYRLISKTGSKSTALVRIHSATYDPSSNSLTLKTRQPLALTRKIEGKVIGSAIASAGGVVLDGSGDERSGSKFIAILAAKRH